MRVDFKPRMSGNRLVGGSISIHRDGGPKIYSESAFWHAVKQDLQRQGYDVIKKLMWKDGHLKDDTEYYVRSRKYLPDSFMLSQNDYAIRAAYDDYNKSGVMDALSIDAAMNDAAADAYTTSPVRKSSVRRKPKSKSKSRQGTLGLQGLR